MPFYGKIGINIKDRCFLVRQNNIIYLQYYDGKVLESKKITQAKKIKIKKKTKIFI